LLRTVFTRTVLIDGLGHNAPPICYAPPIPHILRRNLRCYWQAG
jgi:hypothetical protein